MSKVKEILRYVFSIMLTITITIYIITNIATSTILNKKFILKKLDETSYYTKIYEHVKEKFTNYIQQSGFEEKVLDNIIAEEQVKKDTEKVISNIYSNISEEITAEEIKIKLNENIKEETKNMVLTTEQQKSIDKFVSDICNEYLNGIAHFDFEKQIHNVISNASKMIENTKKIALITISFIIVILIIISKNRIYKLFVFSGIALLSSGTFLFIADNYINANVNVHGLTILNDAFSFALRHVISAVTNSINSSGISLIVMGVLLILLSNFIHNFIKYKN